MKVKSLIIGIILMIVMSSLLVFNDYLIHLNTHHILFEFNHYLLSFLIGITGMSTAILWIDKI